MADIAIGILIGICGAVVFAVIDKSTLALSGTAWWAAMVGVFALAFIAALIIRKATKKQSGSRKQTIGSKNVAGGKMKVHIDGVSTAPDGTSTIGSENKSAGNMDVAIKNGPKG